MSLDLSKLEKPRIKSGKTIARCPACAETGSDHAGDHLFINGDGKFGCVLYPSTSGEDHRKRIFELVGIPEEKTSPRKYTPLSHAPSNAPDPSLRHYKHGLPVAHWTYHTPDGNRAGIIARFNLPDGKKETLPITYCRDQNGDCSWQWKAMPEPRPLYGQPFDDRPIIICEGEKTAEAIRNAGFQATTWPGGCAAVHKADFRPLANRHITVWPDNDQAGFRAMSSVIAICRKLDCRVSIVTIPNSKPEGWDAADSPDEITSIIATSEPYTEPEQVKDVFDDENTPSPPRNRIQELPFRILGMDDGIMRYMPDNGQHIVSLAPGAHTKLNLIQLAPLNAWETVFPAKNGTDWDAAANALIQLSQSLPRFDPRSVRGRGCWIDGESVVYHAGDTLSVAGKSHQIPNFPSDYIYEAGLRINIDEAKSATNAEAARLIHLCDSLSWEQPLYGKLIAGWMALAPICGAMQWRPHIWVTGSAGSGKTWIMGNIIAPLLGRSAIFVQGNTTEAGIRGQIGCDALPVMFDEAEAENNRAASRMEGVMELARQASSESGAGIIKGTQNGGSITYMVRSMFCFSSIGVAAVKKADTSRISVLSLPQIMFDGRSFPWFSSPVAGIVRPKSTKNRPHEPHLRNHNRHHQGDSPRGRIPHPPGRVAYRQDLPSLRCLLHLRPGRAGRATRPPMGHRCRSRRCRAVVDHGGSRTPARRYGAVRRSATVAGRVPDCHR